jgi:heme/copper-type cytochrome/quinol oxidase subunit 3
MTSALALFFASFFRLAGFHRMRRLTFHITVGLTITGSLAETETIDASKHGWQARCCRWVGG